MPHVSEGLETALEHQELEKCLTVDEFFNSWEAISLSGLEMAPLTGINVNNGSTNAEMQPISDQIPYWWNEISLEDCEAMIQWSKGDVHWETEEDLYHACRRGFLLDDEQWFFLDKDGKKCVAVSARGALEEDQWKWMLLAESRFKEMADYCNLAKFGIFCKFRSKLLSPETTYGAYLVYKLPEGYEDVNPPLVLVVDKDSHPREVHNIFLRTPQTPIISYNAKGKALNPLDMPKMEGLPKQRSDGWMEVQVNEFQTRPTLKMVSTRLSLSSYDMGLQGITVQCLEFRPI